MRILSTSPIAVIALALTSCGAGVSAPSLAPRAVEKQPIDMPVTSASEADGPADAALVARIASLVAAAEAGDKIFAAERSRSEAAVARAAGAAHGSEDWVAAQEAVTALDAARGPVRDAAGAIDALRLDPANATFGNRTAIDKGAAQLDALDKAESAALAELAARLGS